MANGAGGLPIAKNVVISNNTFAYGRHNIHLGSFHGYYPLLPQSVVMVNNLARTSLTNALVVVPGGPTSNTWFNGTGNVIVNNLLSGSTTGLTSSLFNDTACLAGSDLNCSTGLVWAHDDFVYRTSSGSSTANTAIRLGAFPVVLDNSTTTFDVDAFQRGTPFRRPLGHTHVGRMAPWNRTNLLSSSQAFGEIVWSHNGVEALDDIELAPDGTWDADLLVETFSEAPNPPTSHSVEQVVSANPKLAHTFSVYVKPDGVDAMMLYLTTPATTSNGVALRVNLADGTMYQAYANGNGQFIAQHVQQLNDGWYRVSLSGIPTTSSGISQIRAVAYLLPSPGGSGTYHGDGASGLYLWGAQLEQDKVATVLESNSPL